MMNELVREATTYQTKDVLTCCRTSVLSYGSVGSNQKSIDLANR